jgi:hypothetical protein
MARSRRPRPRAHLVKRFAWFVMPGSDLVQTRSALAALRVSRSYRITLSDVRCDKIGDSTSAWPFCRFTALEPPCFHYCLRLIGVRHLCGRGPCHTLASITNRAFHFRGKNLRPRSRGDLARDELDLFVSALAQLLVLGNVYSEQ